MGKIGRILPLIAITLLAGLLAAFLYLQFGKGEPPADDASTSAADAAPPETPATPETPETPGAPAPPVPDERAKALERFAGALGKEDFQGAEAAIADLRELGATAEELKDLAAKLRGGREAAEERRKQEARQKAEEAFAAAEPGLEKLRSDYLWDKARAVCRELEEKHPPVVGVSGYRSLRGKIEQGAAEAAAIFEQRVAEAKDLMNAKSYAEAVEKLQQARAIYPERNDDVVKLADIIRDRWQKERMILIREPPKGTSWTVGGGEKPDEPKREFHRGDFWVDKYEVTNEEYALFMRATGREAPDSRVWSQGRLFKQAAKFPVVGVTYHDAEAYAKYVGKRLPTAEEWEAVARFLLGLRYPWGNDFQSDEKEFHCNSLEYSQFRGNIAVMPVGSFPNGCSRYGAYDMAGNVWEWTATPGEVPSNGKNKTFYIIKGGSFMTPADLCRSANVMLEDPDQSHPDLGFRCVKDP